MSTKTVPAVRLGPTCEYCKERMGWIELLRTWGCQGCGYFLDEVCAGCGALYEVPLLACPECGGTVPPSHRPTSEMPEVPAA